MGIDLLPWQRFTLTHALELNRDGSYRFKTVVITVGRQAGKSTLLAVLANFLLFTNRADLIIGAAQSLPVARESWQRAVDFAERAPALAAMIPARGIRKTNGEQCLTTERGNRYMISAASPTAGRGFSADVVILDELRTHTDWSAWASLAGTTRAKPNGLIFCISNAGDQSSIVLKSLRDTGRAGSDDRLCYIEYSAPDGCEIDDRDAWTYSNPGLGYLVDESTLASACNTEPPAVFRTESLNQWVDSLDGPFDLDAWHDSADPTVTLDGYRDRIVCGFDVAPDGQHATLVAAAPMDDDRVRVEVVEAWTSTDAARAALSGLLERIQPRALAWLPNGPAAALKPVLERVDGALALKGGDVPAACVGLADLISTRRVLHADDALLGAHLSQSSKKYAGDAWVIVRRGQGHLDAAYALAAAVHAARTLPEPEPEPEWLVL